jgi:N-acetyl-alpha-D-muramate 1-phosphate uridylyltransferase
MIDRTTKSNTSNSPSGAAGRAMLLCAGLGTRLKPWTDKHPKALAIVNDKSLLQRNIEWLASFGITDIIINLHHFADQIRDAVKEANGWGSNISFSDETDAILETGGGLKIASFFFNKEEPLVLMNVDILTNLDLNKMIYQHTTTKPLATLATTNRETSRYFLFNEENILCGWRNTKTGEEKISRKNEVLIQKAFSGIHVISPEIFSLIKQEGKFSMVDVYLHLAKTHIIRSFDHSNSKFIDVGKPESIGKAEMLFL